MKDYDKIVRQKGLPNVGQVVKSKKYGTLWRILEKKEVWENIEPDPGTGDPRMVPAIYLRCLARPPICPEKDGQSVAQY